MDTKMARLMLDTIREEERTRLHDPHEDTLSSLDHWADVDQPFLWEMVLLLLVGVWHGVEREFVSLAAAHSTDQPTGDPNEYWNRIKKVRRNFNKPKWKERFKRQFNLESLPEWDTIEALRHLANAYKHDAFQRPSPELLRHLGLKEIPIEGPPQVVYAALSDSLLFRRHLAEWLKLPPDSDYCSIASTVLDRVDQFMESARKAIPRNVPPPRASMLRFEG